MNAQMRFIRFVFDDRVMIVRLLNIRRILSPVMTDEAIMEWLFEEDRYLRLRDAETIFGDVTDEAMQLCRQGSTNDGME